MAVAKKPAIYKIPQWPEVKGVSVGGCIQRYDAGLNPRLPGGAQGHAHNDKKSKYFGWICAENESKLGKTRGKTVIEPSSHLRHEYRHILTPGHGHDAAFRKVRVSR